jgi:hypothetical protein
VTVIGEVYNPTSHLYNPKLDRDDYIRLSGNVTESGNKKAIYVVHADGSVSPDGGWLDGRIVMGPGDTVVVPMKLERLSRLKADHERQPDPVPARTHRGQPGRRRRILIPGPPWSQAPARGDILWTRLDGRQNYPTLSAARPLPQR